MENKLDESKLNKDENISGKEEFWKNILEIINKTFINDIKIGIDRPVEENDFIDIKNVIENNLIHLQKLFSDTINENSFYYNFTYLQKNLRNEVTVNTILLCGEHSFINDAWTTNNTLKLSESIIKILCQLYSCNTVENLLVKSSCGNLLPLIFNSLRPKLLKDTWKYYPAAVSSYVWVLLKIKVNI